MNYGACRSCRAQVAWVTSATSGKPMPLTRDDEKGNVVLDGQERAHAFRDHDTALRAIDGETHAGAWLDQTGATWLAHHAVCPARGEWSGKTRAAKRAEPDQQELEV